MPRSGMDEDEIGSVMLSEDEPKLVAPEIEVRPNAAMVTVATVVLIIGAMLTSYSAFSNLMSDEYSDEQLQELIKPYEGTEFEVTIEDMRIWSDGLEDNHYSTVLGMVEVIVTLCFVAGAILLLRRNRIGIYVGGGGAGLYTAAGLWGSWVMFDAASHLPSILSTTFGLLGVITSFCSLTCMAIVFLPLMFASGRAAIPVSTGLQIENDVEE